MKGAQLDAEEYLRAAREHEAAARSEKERLLEEATAEAERSVREATAGAEAHVRGRGRELLRSLHARVSALDDAYAGDVTELAFELARRIVEIEVANRPAAVRDLVRRVVGRARHCRSIGVRLHPDDADLLAGDVDALRSELPQTEELEVRADPQLARGSVQIDTEFGSYDGSVAEQLERLGQLLGITGASE